ncbi:aspartate--tRNA ligase [Patescibacteria group bacterium]|nr:aspartate--tRNA ligase [Patescibacteria group bacterium]
MNRIFTKDIVNKVGETVTVAGWIHARRDMGKVAFFDLRDKDGLLQVVAVPSELGDSAEVATKLRSEWVVEIEGVVQARGAKQVNDKIATGTVELLAKAIRVLNEAKTPPFELDKDTRVINEETRLTYRYLDLRSERMQKNLRNRHAMFQYMRSYLGDQGFIEVETPVLTKGTPEGAREFIVPSRLHAGNFYVLPQSPQQFKQLLMVSGVERYYQLAKCFRDEDQRGDRQPEFTQLDLEMSFVEREDVMQLIEKLLIELVKAYRPDAKMQQVPFPRMSYKEAMEKYGTDRPDIRVNKEDPNEFAFLWVIDFPFFEKTEDGGWTFTHNPFSAALPEWREKLMAKEDIASIITSQYDIVLNGFEIGGGSVRNHQPEALKRVFEIMGFTDEQIEEQFGHMLNAFSYGAPPHGGIALGIDRVLALFQGEQNIREVMAFPKDGNARDHMMGAPSPLPEKALKEANVKIAS